jgi:L-alanine-DL-glutamate epimerase-like enolase superfamily enzyme
VLEYLPIFERLLEAPVAIRNGVARPSESPGHGMRFAAEILEPYRIGAKEAQLR